MSELKITQQALENRQTLLTVEVPEDRVENALRKKVKALSRRIRIPGFRPGKAPYHIIVQRLGREALLTEVAEDMGKDVYAEALEATDLEPVGPGNLINIDLDPLTFQFEVPLEPVVEPGDYRSLRIPFEEPDEEEIEKKTESEIENIREQHRTWVTTDQPIQYGDLVTIGIKVTVDGKVVLENDDWDVIPDEEDYTLTPDFDAAFIGMTAGEQKTFTTTFPEDSDTPWAGKEAVFEIEVKEVQRSEKPEFDDALAAKASHFETGRELRQFIRDHFAQVADDEAQQTYQNKVIDALIDQAQIEHPPILVEKTIDEMMREAEHAMTQFGIESIDEYLRMLGKTEEEYREQLRPDAEKRLRYTLLLDAIAEREQLPVSDYELDQYLIAQFGASEEVLADVRAQIAADEYLREHFEKILRRKKAEELILAIARGEEVPAPGEHVAEEAPPQTDEEEQEEETVDEETANEDETEADEDEEAANEDETEADEDEDADEDESEGEDADEDETPTQTDAPASDE